uniref:Glycosyl hydrolase family 13 catalytic domain-containing protein n=1 Tax=Pyramimonas obovata TaxID=1411642 RepID=A0A7S0RZY6_9CHLO|mmetsp:Transcript_9503/g.19678  ORF Transcript_9503/g.19678 Transcript_9503/m.19678 type:complete len:655 (+) Transcript_9503:53-2017(+)
MYALAPGTNVGKYPLVTNGYLPTLGRRPIGVFPKGLGSVQRVVKALVRSPRSARESSPPHYSRLFGLQQHTTCRHIRRQRSIGRLVVTSIATPRSDSGTDYVLPESTANDDLDWVRESIVYQIFPDRFSRRPDGMDGDDMHFEEWGSPPSLRGFQGGHLLGVVDKLQYLEELGVNTLYLTPVNTSSANHRYHPTDFMAVDPLLGGEAAMRTLLDAAHSRNMRVIVDGVFNHTGRGHQAFVSLLENGALSPYKDWYNVKGWPIKSYEVPENEVNYDCWWDIPELPELNYADKGVRAHILEVGRHWLEMGCDGWRLDAPFRVPMDFWKEFRSACKEYEGAYLVGEVFGHGPEWCGADCFDGVMNYSFGSLGLGFFGKAELQTDTAIGGDYLINAIGAEEFARGVDAMHRAYAAVEGPHPSFLHLNLFDSHDTARALWMLKGDTCALKLNVLMQMTMPGPPMIYYGDEIGLVGGRDPACRGAFPWHKPESWDMDLLDFYKKATNMRQSYRVLRLGGFQRVPVRPSDGNPSMFDELYAFVRWCSSEEGEEEKAESAQTVAVVVFNTSTQPASVDVSLGQFQVAQNVAVAGKELANVWQGEDGEASEGGLVSETGELRGMTIGARSAAVFVGAWYKKETITSSSFRAGLLFGKSLYRQR